MGITECVNVFNTQIIDIINNSHLHPTIAKLVLLNIIKQLEDVERQIEHQSQVKQTNSIQNNVLCESPIKAFNHTHDSKINGGE